MLRAVVYRVKTVVVASFILSICVALVPGFAPGSSAASVSNAAKREACKQIADGYLWNGGSIRAQTDFCRTGAGWQRKSKFFECSVSRGRFTDLRCFWADQTPRKSKLRFKVTKREVGGPTRIKGTIAFVVDERGRITCRNFLRWRRDGGKAHTWRRSVRCINHDSHEHFPPQI